MRLLLEGRLHGLRMKNGGAKEGQLCGLVIGEKRNGASCLHQTWVRGQYACRHTHVLVLATYFYFFKQLSYNIKPSLANLLKLL